ncbi:SDR family oxidoreductase [Nodularia spumigena]|jgi:3-hydroxy acid dehydrogenase / malonic semialdehyde reductase|uniref:NADP-dependent 3-hydroxy acid dehydrogenase YdfG n=3 Tax=Nodularia spumigena TaxID=70799 RepID=A0A2S0Q374_NODSP|nr:SDR family oxidoreductase [Nodularia spumigena]AVZ30926.1 NADP-dependent 3-hydroxy acid dehydrogenase YdfG [Nodularia spumigena UHCC 0039]KZL49270.1 NAD(P)-dependent oxidoreductase [Nodularia spumigena CENA596]MEA5527194.1 SDR family oxidoreductase [Nodularia spumigena UHCC 0143]MEA5555110.1 SDR family oxidoreductase [Nodularia spumigena CH309]MEA5610101.1 SDR family oxidoreductase [Nodularia spumigena UHCC 0060]
MISLENRIILITGASSGIGTACAKIFAGAGAKLILAARRWERLQELADTLNKEFGVETHLLQLDVRDRSAVESAISSLPPAWSDIDILINNAGLSRGLDKLHEGDFQGWDEMIDTNIKGLLYLTRYVVPGMVKRDRGHIVNLGSIAGHQTYPGGNVYCATKAAVKAISEGLKQDLLGTPVRVTSIDPGMVETEFSNVRFHGDNARADKVYQGVTPLTADDVADVIFFCVTRSPHVNINELILMPVDQASATLVHRQT